MLRDYQREFKKLGNKMFKPRSLKKAINLARMRDKKLTRQQWFKQPPTTRALLTLPQTTLVTPATPTVPIKRLTWDEMQRRRA
ncbi:hypothetical protein CK203_108470 [Vitis vinifera]|uniref:Uncharacterized protein n=1 Tax=Vitis vinifera TaxID=29760 RepID=A0A438E930_VITVI|nr:hypothetical protein CK203_108470 [Vitis vinifera]